MSRIKMAFEDKKAFIPFITGGDPDLATTEKLLFALERAGADIIEVGIPFSDPVAEGPVIEAADERALRGGCTTERLLEMLEPVCPKMSVPLVFMTYYNPVFAYGVERFVKRCADIGIAGIIVPDVPFEERDEILTYCADGGIELISLIAPTSRERIERIAKNSSGFLYCVSSLGVTGTRSEINNDAESMIEQARAVSDIPCAVGFGVSTPEQAAELSQFADGVIVGSAIVRIVEEYGKDAEQAVYEFAKSIKDAIS